MEEKSKKPQIGENLKDWSKLLLYVTGIALAIAVIYCISQFFGKSHSYDYYGSRHTQDAAEAFSYVIIAFYGFISSAVMYGFSYVVMASVEYLNRIGYFAENDKKSN